MENVLVACFNVSSANQEQNKGRRGVSLKGRGAQGRLNRETSGATALGPNPLRKLVKNLKFSSEIVILEAIVKEMVNSGKRWRLSIYVVLFWFEYIRDGRACCSVEYRSKQMVMDEEKSFRRDKCSFMAVKATKPDSPAPMSCGGHHHVSVTIDNAVWIWVTSSKETE
ncbi:hypothetical protein YC2023_090263 [Brassica napus]